MLVVRLLPTAVVIADAKQNDMSSVFPGAAARMLHSSELSIMVEWRNLVSPAPSGRGGGDARSIRGVGVSCCSTIAVLDASWQNFGRGGGRTPQSQRLQGIPNPYLVHSPGSKLTSVTKGRFGLHIRSLEGFLIVMCVDRCHERHARALPASEVRLLEVRSTASVCAEQD